MQDLVGQHVRIAGLAQAGKDDGELVTAKARDGVAFPDLGLQAFGHGNQQGIACGVSKPVIDRLEVVQVEEHQGAAAGLPARQRQCLAEAVDKEPPVWKVGQRIVMGGMLHPLLGVLALGDVFENGDVVCDRSIGIKQGRDGLVHRVA